MRLICGPDGANLPAAAGALNVTLYGRAGAVGRGCAGLAAKEDIRRRHLAPSARAWDFLTVALSVVTADFAKSRAGSPDGWTREFELDIAVVDPDFWATQAATLARVLQFLTTDRWTLRFHGGGLLPAPPRKVIYPPQECVTLLSGGLDSLIGTIDLSAAGRKPLVVSQIVRGDADKQERFAKHIGGGLNHLQLNHNVETPGKQEPSQRARSMMFIAFGVIAATSLKKYYDGQGVTLYVCENGFIALNPPLTGGRLGSLSTRTAHPEYLGRLQHIFNAAGLRVTLENPYAAKTKGEMLSACVDQIFLENEAVRSTSCGRYQHYNYHHCGRCVPCQVRRAAFLAWGRPDRTDYVFEALGKNDTDHAGFDDVRSVAMALAAVAADGLDVWMGNAVSSPFIADRAALRTMLERGISELKGLHQAYSVK
jgi:7-cyano-7-deazaguanine synthase in queuosine biosynthesis